MKQNVKRGAKLFRVSKDRLSAERRSWNMSRIRGKDTTPEKIVRSLLHRMGYRFRLHVRIPIHVGGTSSASPKPDPTRPNSERLLFRSGTRGTRPSKPPRFARPDILLPKHKTAIFVHGCFWHRHTGCKNCTTPTNRREWWLAKLNGNAARDKLHQAALRKLGWRVIVIWECEAERNDCFGTLSRQLWDSH
jgi:DNA mismatch endonuclease (patch repair protein)